MSAAPLAPRLGVAALLLLLASALGAVVLCSVWPAALPSSWLGGGLSSPRMPAGGGTTRGAELASAALVAELNASRAEAGRLRDDLGASLAREARLSSEASSSRADAERLGHELALLKAAAAAAAAAAEGTSAAASSLLAGFRTPWWRAVAAPFSARARQEQWLGATQSCRHVRGPRQLRTWAPPCGRDVLNLVWWQVPYNAEHMSWRAGADTPRVFDEPALATWVDSVLRNIGIHGTLPAGTVPDNARFFPAEAASDAEEFVGDVCNIPGLRVRASSRNRAVLRPDADVVVVNYPFAMSDLLGLLPPPRTGLGVILEFASESTEYYPHVTTPAFQAHFDATIGVPQSYFAYAGKPRYQPRGADLAKRPSPPLQRMRDAGGWPEGSALAAAMVSNCLAKNGRAEYLVELMKYMRVDSFGSCHGNAKVDASILARHGYGNSTQSHFAGDYRGVKQELFAGYPFVLAFENANCYDWVTEKPFDALLAGAVPVYMGAPNVHDYLPPNSYIDTRFFSGPAELAAFLMATAADPVAYGAFHAWREDDARAWPWMDDAANGEDVCSVIEMQWKSKCGSAPAGALSPSFAPGTAAAAAAASSTPAAP